MVKVRESRARGNLGLGRKYISACVVAIGGITLFWLLVSNSMDNKTVQYNHMMGEMVKQGSATSHTIHKPDDPPEISNLELWERLHSSRPHFLKPVSQQQVDSFDTLLKKHSKDMAFGSPGRELVDAIILEISKRQEIVVVLEVGVWLGTSVARWLELHSAVRVIAVDPFDNPRADHKKLRTLPDEIRTQFGHRAFNQRLAEHVMRSQVPDAANRAIMAPGYYPDAADFMFDSDADVPQVDVFYLDGGKNDDVQQHLNFVARSILQITKANPNVVVTGDDWNHGDHSYEFQTVVIALAEGLGREVYVQKNWAWVMAPKTMNLSSMLPKDVGRLTKKPTRGKK
eukprot:CAMPEP_0198293554 /NCGR_PEP_ID=MMETSP1449-20131203/17707_1 /TAXON_ID=420275 /ORGANISM="Attheya septentrionalis, Strain CCMP2084" /LENGTH=341 /DNA_ID=CAMNT_0043993173 /DNA_START=233 /DNA_END=1255 /DNA_ORIENTATION=+